MKVFAAVLLVCVAAHGALAAGAGRAFPVASENLAIELFQGVNRNIVWDHTNYLVDLSGEYANCDWLTQAGIHETSEISREGDSITAIVDNTYGGAADVDSVNRYISDVLYSWMEDNQKLFVIRGARKFGCSVRPSCSGQAVVSCLFTPGSRGPEPTIPNPTGFQEGRAFTGDQYVVAEVLTGNRWDRSHFLENLSGFQTSCAMIDRNEWDFANAIQQAGDRGMVVVGLFDQEENRGATQPAMEAILRRFKSIHAKKVGCSLIPDCRRHGRMYVVVSCLYQEY